MFRFYNLHKLICQLDLTPSIHYSPVRLPIHNCISFFNHAKKYGEKRKDTFKVSSAPSNNYLIKIASFHGTSKV